MVWASVPSQAQNIFLYHRQQFKELKSLEGAFEAWLKKTPVLGYNSSKYDVPLIRELLFPLLQREYPNGVRFVKKHEKYTLIDVEDLRFLDMMEVGSINRQGCVIERNNIFETF